MEVTFPAHPSGHGNFTQRVPAVVGPGDSPHHPGLAGPLQLAGVGHPCPASGEIRRPPMVGVVHQEGPHLLRCAGFHAPNVLATDPPFSHVTLPGQQPKTCATSASPDYGCPLLHCVIVQSRAKCPSPHRNISRPELRRQCSGNSLRAETKWSKSQSRYLHLTKSCRCLSRNDFMSDSLGCILTSWSMHF